MDTRDALEKIKNLNALAGKGALNLCDAQIGSLDFTALYPSIPQLDLIEKLRKMIVFGFNLALAQHITKNEAKLNEVFCYASHFRARQKPSGTLENPQINSQMDTSLLARKCLSTTQLL
jgi:hypothetical protein